MPKKERQGVVVSNKMEKTVVVKVASYNPHTKYKNCHVKQVQASCVYHV